MLRRQRRSGACDTFSFASIALSASFRRASWGLHMTMLLNSSARCSLIAKLLHLYRTMGRGCGGRGGHSTIRCGLLYHAGASNLPALSYPVLGRVGSAAAAAARVAPQDFDEPSTIVDWRIHGLRPKRRGPPFNCCTVQWLIATPAALLPIVLASGMGIAAQCSSADLVDGVAVAAAAADGGAGLLACAVWRPLQTPTSRAERGVAFVPPGPVPDATTSTIVTRVRATSEVWGGEGETESSLRSASTAWEPSIRPLCGMPPR